MHLVEKDVNRRRGIGGGRSGGNGGIQPDRGFPISFSLFPFLCECVYVRMCNWIAAGPTYCLLDRRCAKGVETIS